MVVQVKHKILDVKISFQKIFCVFLDDGGNKLLKITFGLHTQRAWGKETGGWKLNEMLDSWNNKNELTSLVWCSAWWRLRRSTWSSWRFSSRASSDLSRWPRPPRTRPAHMRTSIPSSWTRRPCCSFTRSSSKASLLAWILGRPWC